MKTIVRVRQRPLVACLAAALALGTPLAIGSAAPVRFDAGEHASHPALLANVGARLGRAPSAPGGVAVAVTNCNDSGAGSLRDAIENAVDGEVIDLRALTCSTITLGGALSVGVTNLEIKGPGADRLTIDGNDASRLFETGNTTLNLIGLRLQHGYAADDGGCIHSSGLVGVYDSVVTDCHAYQSVVQTRGGAISAQRVVLGHTTMSANIAESGTSYAKGGAVYANALYAVYSTLDGNEARSTTSRGFGGAAFVTGSGYFVADAITGNKATNAAALSFIGGPAYAVSITDSTISGNVAGAFMGGIYTYSPLTLSNSTVAFNCAEQTEVRPGYISAVGVEVYQATLTLQSSIISNNDLCVHSRAPEGSAYDLGLYGPGPVDGANNLVVTSTTPLPAGTIRDDPMLAPLADNGGYSRTHALMPGSPAIGTGNNLGTLPFDQRWHWFARVDGVNPDIGAYETQTRGDTRTVLNCDDSGNGSLRILVAQSFSGDTVDLTGLSCSRITLTSGAIPVGAANLRIVGPGSGTLTIDGNGQDRIFTNANPGRLELEGLSFENGRYDGAPVLGGGCIYSRGFVAATDTVFRSCEAHIASLPCYGGAVFSGGASFADSRIENNLCTSDSSVVGGGGVTVAYDLALTRTTIADNSVATDSGSETFGGGFFAYREATIASSTISGNAALVAAGGYSKRLTVSNSTVSGNTAGAEIGGIGATDVVLDNSTIAFNTVSDPTNTFAAGLFIFARGDLESSILFGNVRGSEAYDLGTNGVLLGADNLVGASPSTLPPGTIDGDPLLGPLQDNGGPTWTRALGDGSPALDAGNNVAGLSTDQRGGAFVRVFNGRADIGAIERQPEPDDTLFANGFD